MSVKSGEDRFRWVGKACSCGWATVLAVSLTLTGVGVAQAAPEEENRGKPFSYFNDKLPAGPWSVHVLKLDLTSQEYEVDTLLARGTILGMETLTDQAKSYPTNAGRPVGAIKALKY